MSSDIQVFVRWKEQTIFAGEDVECIITFKNVAESSHAEPARGVQPPAQRKTPRPLNNGTNGDSYFSPRSPQNSFFHNTRRTLVQTPRQKTFSRSHRQSASLGAFATSHSFPPHYTASSLSQEQLPNRRHRRSVSILSIDSEVGNDRSPIPSQFGRPRPLRGHGRSASLQISPQGVAGTDEIVTLAGRSHIRGSPAPALNTNQTVGNRRVDGDRSLKLSRPDSGTASPVTSADLSRGLYGRATPLPTNFKFPVVASSAAGGGGGGISRSLGPAISDGGSAPGQSPKPNFRDSISIGQQSHLAPVTKIISTSSVNGSNRSSGEFYSLSNNSTETLESEYTNYSLSRLPNLLRHSRHYSNVEPAGKPRNSETLLMGYAQISATFTVDGSLINKAAFEDVKRKGVVGGPGNRSEHSGGGKGRRGGGLWSALGLNAIEDSLTGLLSSGDLNGLRDMRGVASSRSIPLLSTPQSLLFVDLRLAPGEEKSFSFAFTLPKGLPASHKGKAVKFSYNLIIGTQRPSGPKEVQHVNRINVPFRVFSGVNSRGDVLGHDLMVPYVLLRDEARVQKIGSTPPPPKKEKSISRPTWTSASGFLSYVDELLEQKTSRSSPPALKTPLASIRETPRDPPTCKDAIDLAILRSNQVNESNRSTNRFEIARNGRRIAVVVLNRPSHRLGETIIATIDFVGAALPCYSLRATLETSEKVAPSLAMRSSTSVNRATRRVHASYSENTLFATRVVFSPAIPISATPTLLTSGVNLEWELRFEFVTASSHGEDTGPSGAMLLESVGEDDRGSVFASLENLSCESFEISIPLTVYGETIRELLAEESQGYPI